MNKSLSEAIMDEVRSYNDGNGCTRRQLVDNILIAISQHDSRASVAAVQGDAQIDPVNTYPTVIESVQLLEAAGFGAPGKPNTLLAMVKEAIAVASSSLPAELPPPVSETNIETLKDLLNALDGTGAAPGEQLRVAVDESVEETRTIREVVAGCAGVLIVLDKSSCSTCSGCGNEIDPKTCWCGQSIDHGYDNHTAVPMGCDCYRDDAAPAEPLQPTGEQEPK